MTPTGHAYAIYIYTLLYESYSCHCLLMVASEDSLSLDWRICELMLFVNAVWDFISAACIWQSFCIRDVLDILGAATTSGHPANDSEMQAGSAEANASRQCEPSGSISLSYFFQKDSKDEQSAKMIAQIGWRNALCLAIAEMRTSLWATKTDSMNHAACMLMGWWVLTLGVIRLFACINKSFIALAAVSYAVEGIFFLVEGLKSTMTPKKSCYVSLFSFACLLLCAIKIPSSVNQ